ncbi:MAG: B12-binding domain-containing radical SAM protein [Candidatus Adiutrix sp.]|jgi:radical SAM superfamily enzyme YgiQ (UPF0313 family)|nr:B12-binding domain-containing radical SAM protein [Candidatus Adiutrix sp.]
MKILLINPAFYDRSEFSDKITEYEDWVKGGNLYIAPFEPPLGLAYLSAYLKDRGQEVTVIDMQGLMMNTEDLAQRLVESPADLVGITSMTTTFPAALRAARLVRAKLPQAAIVFGGVHPTLDPEGVLAHPEVDYVLRGEGEASLYALVRALKGEAGLDTVEGLARRADGRLIIGEKARPLAADEIPRPDYEAFPIEKYISHNENLRGIRGISMLISRGCPYHCTFCAVQETMGHQWRIKSPELLVQDIIEMQARYKLEGVWFKDSIFNMNRQWVADFCRLLLDRQVKLDWQINTRVDLIDEEQIVLMKKAGLTQIDFGIESGSDRILKILRKNTTVAQIKKAIDIAHRHVKVFGFFMVGIPGETEEDVLATFDLAKKLNLDTSTWSIYSPLPGSPLYDQLLAEGKIEKADFEYESIHFTKAFSGICDIPAERVKELYTEINEYFYKQHRAA